MITFIGDVHNNIDAYNNICNNISGYSVQVGDLGFEYYKVNVDTDKHKCIAGNHEHFPSLMNYGGWLGWYGTIELDGLNVFFCGGAGSIDKKYRIEGFDWFPCEELNEVQFEAMKEKYKQVKPDLVVTHTCPTFIKEQVSNPEILRAFGLPDDWCDSTSVVFDSLFELHRPNRWIFGHFHERHEIEYEGTNFTCLSELETMTLA